jgi:hypothetical protein
VVDELKIGEAPAPAGAAFEWGGKSYFLPAVTQADKHELAAWAAETLMLAPVAPPAVAGRRAW